jgi:hypothetical protein
VRFPEEVSAIGEFRSIPSQSGSIGVRHPFLSEATIQFLPSRPNRRFLSHALRHERTTPILSVMALFRHSVALGHSCMRAWLAAWHRYFKTSCESEWIMYAVARVVRVVFVVTNAHPIKLVKPIALTNAQNHAIAR